MGALQLFALATTHVYLPQRMKMFTMERKENHNMTCCTVNISQVNKLPAPIV